MEAIQLQGICGGITPATHQFLNLSCFSPPCGEENKGNRQYGEGGMYASANNHVFISDSICTLYLTINNRTVIMYVCMYV